MMHYRVTAIRQLPGEPERPGLRFGWPVRSGDRTGTVPRVHIFESETAWAMQMPLCSLPGWYTPVSDESGPKCEICRVKARSKGLLK